MRGPSRQHRLPLWPKIAWTAFAAVLVPVYWAEYGPANFLWFSDIALFGTVAALWLENGLLASMMALGVTIPELAWNVDFLAGLVAGAGPLGLADYMFDSSRPLWLRAVSLFHVPLPATLLWLVWRLGYDRRALGLQTALAWAVLPVSYVVSSPSDNINWVYGFGSTPQEWAPPLGYLGLLMLGFPLLVYLPTRFALAWLFERR